MDYSDIVQRRRNFRWPGYQTLADVGMDGDWVTPLQISSRSADGPVIVAFNWLDAELAVANREVLLRFGYLPGIPFNTVLDQALGLCGKTRADIYLTQAFHLLPSRRSGGLPAAAVEASFQAVTKHELTGRRVVTLGSAAARACRSANPIVTPHPSARGQSFAARAETLAAALAEAWR